MLLLSGCPTADALTVSINSDGRLEGCLLFRAEYVGYFITRLEILLLVLRTTIAT